MYDRGVRNNLCILRFISNFFQTGRSRGFGFIYYDDMENAREVRDVTLTDTFNGDFVTNRRRKKHMEWILMVKRFVLTFR